MNSTAETADETEALSAEVIYELQHAFERHLDEVETRKVAILIAGGVSGRDWRNALDAWWRAHRINDDFGYVVSVALTRAAERLAS